MIPGLLWMTAANAAVTLAAAALSKRLRTGDDAIDLPLLLTLRLTLVSAAVLAAGLAGALTPAGLGIPSLLLLGGLLAFKAHRGLSLPRPPLPGRWTGLLAAALLLRLLLQVWFFAPYSGDALAYHLPKIAEWVRAGTFTREMGLDSHASFPAGFELIETWWVVFLRHDVLIEVAGVEFAALGFAAVAGLARKLGLAPGSAFLAGLLYLLTPLFALQSTSCLNDAPAAALVLVLAGGVFGRLHPALLLLPLGLAAGIKGTALYTLPGWILLAWLRRKEPLLRPASAIGAWILGAAASACGGFWYLRNLLWFGNPFHPVTREGHAVDMIHIQAGPKLESLARNFSALVGPLVADGGGPYTTISRNTAGWGIVAFGCGGAALLLALRKERDVRVLGACFGVSLLSVLIMVSHDPWFARFVLFFPALLCIAAARFAAESRPAALAVAAGAVLQFATTLLPLDVGAEKMLEIVRQPWNRRSAAFRLELEGLPPGEAVAVYATTRTKTYPLYGPDHSRRLLYLRVTDGEQALAEMRREGVRWLWVNVRSHRRKAELADLVKQSRLREAGPGLYALP